MMPTLLARKKAKETLAQVCLGEGRETRARLRACVDPHVPQVVARLLEDLQGDEMGRQFLSHELVQEKLQPALEVWIRGLLAVDSEADLDAFLERQLAIGHVHARVRVPLYMVMFGVHVLRRELASLVQAADLTQEARPPVLRALHDLLDSWIILVNESFVVDALRHEREAQALKDHLLGRDVAVECERARAALFDWARQTVDHLHRRPTQLPAEGTVASPLASAFGQWLLFKADFILSDTTPLQELQRRAQGLEELVTGLTDTTVPAPAEVLDQIDAAVSDMAIVLLNLAERNLAQEGGKDALTRLLNRRYLPTVLQRETRLSAAQNSPFSVALIDVDGFKVINDAHGHETGDQVLQELARLILDSVRASDFAFRYGGEEFALVLGNTGGEQAMLLGERIRTRIARHSFGDGNGKGLSLTVSIGIAAHDGHPDFHRVLGRADRALYQAKQEGRNLCRLAELPATA